MNVYSPARPRECYLDRLNGQLLDILRQNPDIPFSISQLAEMMGKTHFQIKNAIEELEGPIASEVPGAFVRFWRLTDEAVFIP